MTMIITNHNNNNDENLRKKIIMITYSQLLNTYIFIHGMLLSLTSVFV